MWHDDTAGRPNRRAFLQAGVAAGLTATGWPGLASAASFATVEEEAQAFLKGFVEGWLPLYKGASEAAWSSSTDVSEEHTADKIAREQAFNEFVGSPDVINGVRKFLAQKDKLSELTVRQLEKVRLRAAESPGTVPEVVKARTEAEAKQAAAQDGFAYTLKTPGHSDKSPSPNEIDKVLVTSRDLGERQVYWEVSKTIGEPLRPGILNLRNLRNQVAKAVGFDSFFALQVADYGLTVDQMVGLCDNLLEEIRPLHQQLHAWAKHTLAKRYKAEVPEGPIPAHWLPNRWGQNWPGLVEGVDMDAPFQSKSREYVTEQAERFYVSLGFPKLPKSFYEKSDLYPADPRTGRKKNSHASAWHIDLNEDVRSLMSIEPDSRWFTTAHHELGHIYYYISYSTPKVPYLLREGANRAFHEGIGDLIGLAAGQTPYLKQVGLFPAEAAKADRIQFLLETALDKSSVIFLPFSAGTMTHFERDFYAGTIPDGGLNAAWWSLVQKYQGISAPGPRPESLCDAATKTHINDDPGQYYDYAIGTAIKFQLHDHIARVILKQDPRECNYYGNAKVGSFLRSILELGATRDWNAVLKDATGEGLSAKPMLRYFEPLLEWLQVQNRGRMLGW